MSGRIFTLDKSFVKDEEVDIKKAGGCSEGKILKLSKACICKKSFADNGHVKINLEIRISQIFYYH